MNPVYAILGGPVWRLFGKKYLLWYNHPKGNFLARMAIRMADVVLCTSSFAFARRYQKTHLMPAGIDTDRFQKKSGAEKIKGSILYLGRISPIKKIEHLIDAAKLLDEKKTDFILNIIGSPMVDDDIEYEEMIKASASELIKKGKIKFFPKVTNSETPAIYNQNEIFVNLTPKGSFDKTVLEAMACETMVLASNRSFDDILPKDFIFKENSAEDLAEKLNFVLNLSGEIKKQYGEKFRKHITEKHSLDKLIGKINEFVS
jgi:glycosyltransferase involved in cell wall biosynthesis